MVSRSKRRPEKTGAKSLRWIARAVLFIWSVLALWVLAGALIYEGWPEGRIHTVQAVVIIIAFFIAWWLDLVGGILLVALAVISFVAWGRHNAAVALLGCLPLLVAGALFIVSWAAARPPRPPKPPPAPTSPASPEQR